ncbi:Hypothetical_protein [Hexamita inflata]|uniref:Hypothetical_protein n=1 Tax=Hexamita inflata TaxID=28002 RepID=A0AA86U5E0_9EUKA|nr:Hypothetical protein HINF_LOCUS29234 [Hexamita inflata]
MLFQFILSNLTSVQSPFYPISSQSSENISQAIIITDLHLFSSYRRSCSYICLENQFQSSADYLLNISLAIENNCELIELLFTNGNLVNISLSGQININGNVQIKNSVFAPGVENDVQITLNGNCLTCENELVAIEEVEEKQRIEKRICWVYKVYAVVCAAYLMVLGL